MLNRLVFFLALSVCVGAIWTSAARASFPDVPVDHWAYDAVQYLEDKGMITGYPDGTFGGDRVLTRYEFAKVVSKLYDQFLQMENKPAEEKPGVDVQAVIDKLIKEFDPEIADLRGLAEANAKKIDALDQTTIDLGKKVEDINKRVDSMNNPVSTHSDLTLRFEGTYPDKGLQTQRGRYMFHYGFVVPITDELTFGAQLCSGTTGSRQTTFVNMEDSFGIDPLNIDRAYMQYSPKCLKGLTAWGGKFQPPWKSTPVVYDTDVMVEGIAQKYTSGNVNVFLGELVPTSEGFYIVGQAGVNNLFFKNNTVALTYHLINGGAWKHIAADMKSGTLTNNWAFANLKDPKDYKAIEGDWDWTGQIATVPIRGQLTYYRNFDSTAAAEEGGDKVHGWQQALWARLTFLATPADPGDWNCAAEWGRIEPNSVLSFLSDPWRGAGDADFWAVAFTYRLMKNTDFNVSLSRINRIASDSSFDDLLVNFSTKFN